MLFPIGDTQVHKGYKAYVSHAFLAINILVFLYEVSLGPQLGSFIMKYGSIPNEITNGEDLFTLFTCMFLHGGWMHLIGNMMFLWIFGDNIEATIGSLRFATFYIVGGLIASAAHILLNPSSGVPTVGASGAIAAVMGAYLVMFPKSEIKVVLVVLFKTFKMPAILFLGIWFAQQLISGVGSLSVATSETAGVAWWAHIGGFVYGLVAGWTYRDEVMKVTPGRYKYVEHNNA